MPPKRTRKKKEPEALPKCSADDKSYTWETDDKGELVSIDDLPLQRVRVADFQNNFCPAAVEMSSLYHDLIQFFLTMIIFADESIFAKVSLEAITDKFTPEFGYSFLNDHENQDLFKTGYKQFPAGITNRLLYDMADPGTQPTYTLKDDFVAEYRANIQRFLSMLFMYLYCRTEPPFSSGHLRTAHIVNTPRPNNQPRPDIFTTRDQGNRSIRVAHGNSLNITYWDYEKLHDVSQTCLHSWDLAAMIVIYLVDVLPFCRAHPELGFGHSDYFFTDFYPNGHTEEDFEPGEAMDADGDTELTAEKPFEKFPPASLANDKPWSQSTIEETIRRETKLRTGVEMSQKNFEKVYIGIMEKRTAWTFRNGLWLL